MPFDEESKLVYGVVLSLRNMVKRLSGRYVPTPSPLVCFEVIEPILVSHVSHYSSVFVVLMAQG